MPRWWEDTHMDFFLLCTKQAAHPCIEKLQKKTHGEQNDPFSPNHGTAKNRCISNRILTFQNMIFHFPPHQKSKDPKNS